MFLVTFLPVQGHGASQPYTERLTGFVAGSDALWFMQFGGVNVTAPKIVAAEAPGVTAYNLTVIQTTSWTSDMQVFGPNGYNLIPVPFIPQQGAFLNVAAASYDVAKTAASQFGQYLLTSFISYTNGSSAYTFVAPITFNTIVPATLLNLMPTTTGGFSDAITVASFVSTRSPIVVLQGVRGSSGFTHTLTLGSISAAAFDASSRPNVLKYFGTTITYLQASNRSSSSVVELHFLDGGVASTDASANSTNRGSSGSYSIAVAPGKRLYRVNATVLQLQTLLVAERVVDAGVLMPGQNVSVTLSLSNPLGSKNVTVSAFSDDWWKSYGFFKLVKGSSDVPSQVIVPQGDAAPTYVLRYNGTTIQKMTIPSVMVPYTFRVGAATFKGGAFTNPVSLSLGEDMPAVYAYASPSTTGTNYGAPYGATEHYTVVIKNVGTLTASSLVVSGLTEGGLAPRGLAGDSVTVSLPVTAASLTAGNYTRSFLISYVTPGGQTETVTTNPLNVAFSHATLSVPFPLLTLAGLATPMGSGKVNLTLTIAMANQGAGNATSLVATGTLPPGLPCGKATGSGLSCIGSTVTITQAPFGASKTWKGRLQFNLTSPVSYFFTPFAIHATGSLNVSAMSNPAAAPSGVVVTKAFSPTTLFGGLNSNVTIRALNKGPMDFYNATLRSSPDYFDKLTIASASLSSSAQDVASGGNMSATYNVDVQPSYHGNLTASPTTLSLTFGGTQYLFNLTSTRVSVYQPISVVIVSTPASPIEGKAFSVMVTISNPSNVTVADVEFALPIPKMMSVSNLQNAQLVGGALTMSQSMLGPHQSFSANATAQATSGVSLIFTKGSLSFQYSGTKVKGIIPSKDIVVGEDVLTRYTLPGAIVLVAVLAVAFYLRRRPAPTSPASQQ